MSLVTRRRASRRTSATGTHTPVLLTKVAGDVAHAGAGDDGVGRAIVQAGGLQLKRRGAREQPDAPGALRTVEWRLQARGSWWTRPQGPPRRRGAHRTSLSRRQGRPCRLKERARNTAVSARMYSVTPSTTSARVESAMLDGPGAHMCAIVETRAVSRSLMRWLPAKMRSTCRRSRRTKPGTAGPWASSLAVP